jgi:hypothetical protein
MRHAMAGARETVSSSPTASPAAPERVRIPEPAPARDGLSRAAGNRALARAMADAAASRSLGFAEAAATRTLARCPGCGGRCGGTCGNSRRQPDEQLLDSGQRALRRAVVARHGQGLSPRS